MPSYDPHSPSVPDSISTLDLETQAIIRRQMAHEYRLWQEHRSLEQQAEVLKQERAEAHEVTREILDAFGELPKKPGKSDTKTLKLWVPDPAGRPVYFSLRRTAYWQTNWNLGDVSGERNPAVIHAVATILEAGEPYRSESYIEQYFGDLPAPPRYGGRL